MEKEAIKDTEKYFIEESDYQNIKKELNKTTDYFSLEDIYNYMYISRYLRRKWDIFI